ncbi:MAG: hypothetical protein OXG30_06355 [bacterium]|nr:hypothetical protein [bacterium]
MQQSPDENSPALDPYDNNRHAVTGIEQLESVPITDESETQFHDKYTWMAYIADKPIEYDIFDTRAQNALKRNKYSTWGHLGTLTDESLYKMPYVGVHTVDRINKALKRYQPTTIEHSLTNSDFSQQETDSKKSLPDPRTYIALEWARAFTDDDTLGGLLEAHRNSIDVPSEVAKAIDIVLATSISELSGHHVPVLGDLIDKLIAEASDPELFVARECSRHKSTLEELGDSRNLTRERIRQIVARDANNIHEALGAEEYQCIRWAIDQLRVEFGILIPADHDNVRRWKTRLGKRRFEILRWVAGYVYNDDVLLQGKQARSELKQALDQEIGEQWLIEAKDLTDSLDIFVRPEIALSILIESGQWRDIGDGWLVRWDGAIQDKAERVLKLICRPMTPGELIEAIGHGSISSLKNRKGSNLMRVDKAFRLALRDWGMEEYEGIITEITQRIERGGGVASKSAIIDEFTNDFGVSVTSINMNLGLSIFNVVGDSVRFADSFNFDPMPPSTMANVVQTTEGWGERHTVTEEHMRGYSFGINPHIAWANGVRPSDSLVVRVNGSSRHEASVIWRITNLNGRVDVGCLRTWLEEQAVGPGASLLLCPTPTGVNVYVGEDDIQAARPEAPPIAPDIAAMMEDL